MCYDSFWGCQLPDVILRTHICHPVGLCGEACGNTVGTRGQHELFLPCDPRWRISNSRFQPCVHHLLNAGLVRVEQRPGLHMFWYKVAAHSGDVLPVSQSIQSHVLICGLLLTCG